MTEREASIKTFMGMAKKYKIFHKEKEEDLQALAEILCDISFRSGLEFALNENKKFIKYLNKAYPDPMKEVDKNEN